MKRAKNKSLKVSENQFGVLLENMDSKIDLVLEQYSFLDKKIGDVNSNLGKKIDDVRLELKTELLSFKSETKNNFKSIFEYLSKIDDELQFIKAEISEIKSELKKKADLSYIRTLEERIKKLEKSNMEIRMIVMQKSG